MSLETLLEAARYVEQQELRAKLHNVSPPPGVNVVTIAQPLLPVTGQILSTSTTVVAADGAKAKVNLGQPVTPVTHSIEAIPRVDKEIVLTPSVLPGIKAEVVEPLKTLPATHQPVLEIVTKPLPLLNGFEKSTILIPTTNTSSNSSQSDVAKHFSLPTQSSPISSSISSSQTAAVTSKRHITLNAQSLVGAAVTNGLTNGHGPSVMRSGTREVHNKLEKNRRAHLKECFEMLKKQLPPQQDEKKSSNLSILHSAIRYIQALKKRERENEHEMERLAREKIAAQQRLASLKKELGSQWDNIDFNCLLPENGGVVQQTINSSNAATLLLKEEQLSSIQSTNQTTQQLSVLPLHTSSVGAVNSTGGVTAYHSVPMAQSLAVVGLHKLALVGSTKAVQLQSPVTHIITAPPQLNGKVVPLVNAQYLMKPVVVVSTPSAATTAISPRQS